MSGFIAQALLGATGGAATGMGNKLREEAKLKRQQALEGTRTQNRMTEQSQNSALRMGEQATQNEYTTQSQASQNEFVAGESSARRTHESSLADKRFGREKDLVKFKLKVESEAAKASGDVKINPNTQILIDEAQSNLKHLRELESNLRTQSTDQFGGLIGGSTEEGGLTVEEVNTRTGEWTTELNKLLGNTKPTDADNSTLAMAISKPPEERVDFLESLKSEKRATPELIRAVESVYAMDAQAEQKEAAQKEAERQAATQTQPEPQPSGGMITQAQAEPPVQPAPTATQPPNPEPKPRAPETTSKGVLTDAMAEIDSKVQQEQAKPVLDRKLGAYIEKGVVGTTKAVGDWYTGAKAEERNERRSTLVEIASGEDPFNGNRQALMQFLKFSRNEMKDLEPAQIQQLEKQLGPDLVARFLNDQ